MPEMRVQSEEDFPKGHPGRSDSDPSSPEAQEWLRRHVSPLGERDFPVDHPGAVDTPGNLNHIEWAPGVDPFNPHREAHTGRTPVQAAGVAQMSAVASAAAKESPVTQPLDAAVVNSALDAKRLQVGRDVLTPEEYSGVVAQLQRQTRTPEGLDEVKRRIELQHQALAYLLTRGYTRNTALELISKDGPEKYLAERDAAAQGA